MDDRTKSPSRLQNTRAKGTYLRVPRRCEGCDEAVLAGASLHVDAARPRSGSFGRLRQAADPDQVVRRQAEEEHPAHSRPAAMPRFAQQPARTIRSWRA
jgi:hypothetical protein